jgi:hypothetical protein
MKRKPPPTTGHGTGNLVAQAAARLARGLPSSRIMSHVRALSRSLLLAFSAVTIACGGTTQRSQDDGNTGSGGGNPGAGKTGTSEGPGKMLPPTGGTGPGPGRCTSPKTDPQSGLVTCAEQYAHRPTAVACDIVGGAPAEGTGGDGSNGAEPADLPRADPGPHEAVSCKNSSDCRGFQYGYCDLGPGMLGASRVCLSGCLDDADCGSGICLCTGPTDHGGKCVPSDCATDADCGAGLFCASYDSVCGGSFFACQSPSDECRSNADCASRGGGVCSAGGHRICASGCYE